MEKDIKFYREKINEIDEQVSALLYKRFDYAKEIGKIKKEVGLKIKDKEREKEIIKARLKQSSLSDSFLEKLYKLIFKESLRVQKKI